MSLQKYIGPANRLIVGRINMEPVPGEVYELPDDLDHPDFEPAQAEKPATPAVKDTTPPAASEKTAPDAGVKSD